MIVDHIGYYFFPDQLWLRLIGRIAFPLFLFLVWYSNSYRWRRDIFLWWVGLWVLQVFLSTNYYFSPNYTLNILLGIVIARAVLFFNQQTNEKYIIPIHIVFLLFYTFLFKWVDYWSFVVFFAFLGYFARHKKTNLFLWYSVLLFIGFMIQTLLRFKFGLSDGNITQTGIFFLFFVFIYISFYKLKEKNFSIRLTPIRDKTMLWISKHALIIYVVHIVVFSIIFAYKLRLY